VPQITTPQSAPVENFTKEREGTKFSDLVLFFRKKLEIFVKPVPGSPQGSGRGAERLQVLYPEPAGTGIGRTTDLLLRKT